MSNRIGVGHLVGVFGVKGWLKVKSNTQPAENIINYKPWFLKTAHGLKEIEIDDYAFRPQGLIIHIKGCDDRDQAEAYGKANIEVEIAQLPGLEGDDYYWHQLIGLKVFSEYGGGRTLLGEVKSLMETGANDVLIVASCEGAVDDRERLVPYLPGDVVGLVDLSAGEMNVAWDPEF